MHTTIDFLEQLFLSYIIRTYIMMCNDNISNRQLLVSGYTNMAPECSVINFKLLDSSTVNAFHLKNIIVYYSRHFNTFLGFLSHF